MRNLSALFFLAMVFAPVSGCSASNSLRLTFLGNSGFLLTDGRTTIAIDFPYQSGAFGYMEYDDSLLKDHQADYCLFTHSHADHRANELIRVFGCIAMGKAELAPEILTVDSFKITAIPTSHSDDHISLRIEWNDRSLYFTGDTESLDSLKRQGALTALIIIPWLLNVGEKEGLFSRSAKIILSHHLPNDTVPANPAVLVPRQNQVIVID